MKTYQVEIAETLQKVIEVKADSPTMLLQKTRALYKSGRYCPRLFDYMKTEFSLYEDL